VLALPLRPESDGRPSKWDLEILEAYRRLEADGLIRDVTRCGDAVRAVLSDGTAQTLH
jgi:phage terminase large subunit-like protein